MKINIDKNPFDYTFKNYIIPGNKIIFNETVEIYYDNNLIYSFPTYYSNVVLPPLIQRIHKINKNEIPNSLTIRFSEPIKSGADEVRNRFYLSNGESRGNCILQNDNFILNCDYPEKYNYLYYEGMYDTHRMDYEIRDNNYSNNNIYNYFLSYLSGYNFVLPGNNKYINFYFDVHSSTLTFPLQVFVNDELVKPIKIDLYNRRFYYSTNQPGNYYIYFLEKNKDSLTEITKVEVKNDINDFISCSKSYKTCFYYTENFYFDYYTCQLSVRYEIYYKIDKYYYSTFYCQSCTDNIFHNYDSQSEWISSQIYFYSDREGFVTIKFKSKYNTDTPFYENTIFFTDIKVPRVTYSLDIISISSICLLDNLIIRNNKTNKAFTLNCENNSINRQYYCKPNASLEYGLYNLYYNNNYINNFFISVSIEKADLDLKYDNGDLKIESNNFALSTISKVIVKDSDLSVISSTFDKFTNYLIVKFDIDFEKNYYIILYDSKGEYIKKKYNKTKMNYSFSLTRKYYFKNINYEKDSFLEISNDNYKRIKYIYYANEDNNKLLKSYKSEYSLGNSNYLLNLKNFESGTYLFFYSYTNNSNIYDIHTDEKFIVRKSINDFASFSPLPNTILKTMD